MENFFLKIIFIISIEEKGLFTEKLCKTNALTKPAYRGGHEIQLDELALTLNLKHANIPYAKPETPQKYQNLQFTLVNKLHITLKLPTS